MKTYNVTIYRFDTHGNAGAAYKGIANFTIEAKNKTEAKDAAFDALIGKRAGDLENFPIAFEHAPEAKKEIRKSKFHEDFEYPVYSMSYLDSKEHIINEFDVDYKNRKRTFTVDVVEIKA